MTIKVKMKDIINDSQGNSYYFTLKNFKPACYSGSGVPFLLVNKNYRQSLPCLAFINIIFVVIIVLSIFSSRHSADSELKRIMTNVYILALIFINISYLLTVFMNPGIVSEQHMHCYDPNQVKYCQRCNRKTIAMYHCIQCEVCVQDLDHHCGFFGKCIAGPQRFAFYAFILFIFCGFIVLLVGISMNFS